MNKRKTQEEISAHLDGEARDAQRIDALLRESTDAARQFAAMSRLSQRLRAMPGPDVRQDFASSVIARIESECAPEVADARLTGRLKALPEPHVHPAFARRVVAAIQTEQAAKPTAWRFPVAGSAWAAAAAAVLVALALFGPVQTTEAPTQVAGSDPTQTSPDPATLNESALLAQFDERLTSDSDVQRIVIARFEPSAEPEDLYTPRLLTALSGSGAAATGEAFAHGADYRATLRRMDREQTSAVKQLLEESMREAHKG